MAKPIVSALRVLNEFFESDREACQQLLNAKLPTNPVDTKKSAQPPVTALSLITDILEAMTGERLATIMCGSKLEGFTTFKPKLPDTDVKA